jgi:DNA-binding CsgD family transcriptional regulator
MNATTTAQPARAHPGIAGALSAPLEVVLDELAYGVAVATATGELVHANHAARHELGRQEALWVQGGRLRAQTPQDLQVLQQALAKAATGRRSLVTLAGPQSQRLSVAVVPMRRQQEGAPVHVALMFSRPSVCGSLMLCFFARSHSLTTAEENVLAILCEGCSAPEIARKLKVAVSTVRSHVRSLCAKTRSSGVRELVNRVAMLPPLAPAPLMHEAMH